MRQFCANAEAIDPQARPCEGTQGRACSEPPPKCFMQSSCQHHIFASCLETQMNSNIPEAGTQFPALNIYNENKFFRHLANKSG